MKMKHITLTIMAFALVVALAPSAQAICSPPKTFGSWDTNLGYYTYVTGWNQNNALTTGSFWQTGARADHNEGTHTDDAWMRYYPGYGGYISGNLGDGGVVGCPSGNMILVMTQDNGDGTASFAASRESENLGGFFAFQQPNLAFTTIPRPRATASSRAGADVVLDLELSAIDGGFATRTAQANPITAFNLYTFHGAADPGRDVGAWTLHSTIPYAGGVTAASAVSFSCADDGNDTFVAAGLVIDGVVSLQVSGSTALECDPTLADPDDKFDIIRDRGQGQKKGKPFRDR